MSTKSINKSTGRLNLDKNYWNAKRLELKNSYNINDCWRDVITRFESRIKNFYFNPIAKVKEPKDLNGEGFTILTIQCALIEMFAAFKYGRIHNYKKRGNKPKYLYRFADECFEPFLHSEPIFENHFHKFESGLRIDDQPYSAKTFYNEVRCGLMHEARTKGQWIVKAKRNYKGDETIFITPDTTENTIIVDRTILQIQLEKYFSSYLNMLLQDTDEGCQARRLFARKLDHLYDLTPDPINFDWWEDR